MMCGNLSGTSRHELWRQWGWGLRRRKRQTRIRSFGRQTRCSEKGLTDKMIGRGDRTLTAPPPCYRQKHRLEKNMRFIYSRLDVPLRF
ncbi:hypothetical protein J6590_060080 [Homalodisca vitripennis]|nr:hypothetical protein J6590_060080 [Homalodisca vitripennis]